MSCAVKNPLVLVGAAFGLFFLIAQPLALAALVLAVLKILEGFGDSMVSFMSAMF